MSQKCDFRNITQKLIFYEKWPDFLNILGKPKLTHKKKQTGPVIWSLISKSKFPTKLMKQLNIYFICIWRYGRDLFQCKMEYKVLIYLYKSLFIWLFWIFSLSNSNISASAKNCPRKSKIIELASETVWNTTRCN